MTHGAPAITPRPIAANVEIEANVLACALLDSDLLADVPRIEPADFYYESHIHIWRVVVDLLAAGRKPTHETVADEIESRGWQTQTQGRDETGLLLDHAGYLLKLVGIAYTPSLASGVLKLLDLSRCRKGVELFGQAIDKLRTGPDAAMEILEGVKRRTSEILDSAMPEDRGADLVDFAQDAANTIIEYSHTPLATSGASTGIVWLNRAMEGGFQQDDFIVMGARPGTGKTKWALAMLASATLSGAKVGMLSLDMGKKRLMPYITPAFANVRALQYISGHQVVNPGEDGELGEARLRDAAANIAPRGRCRIISDPSSYALSAVSGYLRMMARDGCQVLLLDQLQDIAEWADGADRRGIYARIFHELRINVARRHHVTLIALHQISRGGTDRPRLEHLKDTGCVEELIDFAILLHDYQRVLRAEHGGFIMDGDEARAPKANERKHMLTKTIPQRLISVDLAKSRSSDVMRADIMFDYVHGIAVRSE